MNQKEKQMASYLLNKARNEFSNHGCNDVNDEIYEGWSLEERRALVKDFHRYNGDPEEYNPDFLNLYDYTLMGYFSSKLESEEGKLETESDKLAMGFHNWCTKLTIDKDENCFVVLGARINAQIKPTGVLLKIYKKTLKKT